MSERDYVLGTEDDEIERLGLQHRVWRPWALDAWRRAGIAPGKTVFDIGAGPGYAAADLAEIVGPEGRVVALERSDRFLASLRARADRLGLGNVEARAQDVSETGFGEAAADATWCRWVLSFVADPRATIASIAAALKPGGAAVFHEYADYGAWQMLPPNAEFERFRTLVMQSWRDAGGEPDIALQLPTMLAEQGLRIVEVRPLVHVASKDDPMWQWPASFMETGARRLHALGYLGADEAERLATLLERAPPESRMITPLVLELIARRD